MLKIVKLAAGSLVPQSTGNSLSSLGYVPRWMNSQGVPEWFRSRFRGHCCYRYRAMGYYGSPCEYQHDFIAEVVSEISAREVFQS